MNSIRRLGAGLVAEVDTSAQLRVEFHDIWPLRVAFVRRMATQVVGPSPKSYNAAETLASFDTVSLLETAEDSALAALQSLVSPSVR